MSNDNLSREKRDDSKSQKKADIRKLKKKRNSTTGFVMLAIIGTILFFGWSYISNLQSKGKEISPSELIVKIQEGDYEKITIKDDHVILEKGEKQEIGGREINIPVRVHAAYKADTDFYDRLDAAKIDVTELENVFYEPNFEVPLPDILLLILLGAGVAVAYMMVRNMQQSGGRLMDFGQSKARLIFGKKTGITFNDVAGIEDAREELVEVVDFLRNPKKYIQIGARIPRGVLLVGRPGTGKTLLAKAVAGEAGVPFFHTSGSEFEEMLVGAGASRVRDLFKKAKRASPSIIFIDEIDAIAKKRGTVLHAGNGEQTLNQILVEMDGLEGRENVIILAATNRPDVLDPAILRPGRFDRTVVVDMPDLEGRKAIIQVHSKGKKFEEGVDMDVVAKKTIGYSGADLENLLNEAAIMAAKDDRKKINQDDLLEAFLKVKIGRKKKNKRTDEDLKRVAYHEAGHAVVSKFTKNSDPVEKVSITSRGMTGGVTVYVPEEEETMTTKSKMQARINTSVGGKVAEELFLGEMSTGASGDIRHATEIAKAMVMKYGMTDKLGFVQYGNLDEAAYLGYSYGGERDFSEDTAKLIDEEVKKLIDDAQGEAKEILNKYKDTVEKLVEILLEREFIDREEFDALF